MRRLPLLEKERDALARLLPVLADVARCAEARARAREERASLLLAAGRLGAAIEAARRLRSGEAEDARREEKREEARYKEASSRRNQLMWSSIVLESELARTHLAEARDKLERLESERDALRVRAGMATAAIELAELRALRTRREAVRLELDQRLAEARPALQDLQRAALALDLALRDEASIAEGRLVLIEQERTKLAACEVEAHRRDKEAGATEAALRAEIRSASKELAGLDKRRAALEADGALATDEPPAAARERHEMGRRALAREDVEDRAAIDATRTELATLEGQIRGHAELGAKKGAEAAYTSDALSEAEARLASLAADPRLAAVLEDPAPDLLGLGGDAIRRVGVRIQALSEELLALSIERAGEDRALDWLEAHELLPPSIEAERVHRALREAGIRAHSGGAYLADNATEAVRADALVRAHPELASGVIVQERDLERAARALSEAGIPGHTAGADLTDGATAAEGSEGLRALELDSPVVVGTAAEVLNESEPRALVVLPRRALYDRAAAVAERERRSRAAGARTAQLERLAADRRGLEELRASLEHFLLQHGRDWFEGRRRLLARLLEELDLAKKEREVAEERARSRKTEVVALEERLAARVPRKLELERRAAALSAFLEAGGGAIESKRRRIAELSLEAEGAVVAQRAARLEVERSVAARRELEGRIGPLLAEREALSKERGRIAADVVPAGVVVRIGLDPARAAYDEKRKTYEQRTAKESLAGRIEELDSRIRALEPKLERRISVLGVAEAAIAEWLDGAESSIGLERARERADEELHSADDRVVEARGTAHGREQAARRCADDVAKLERDGRTTLVREVTARARALEGVAALERALSGAGREQAEASAEESEAARLRAEHKAKAERAESEAKDLGHLRARLADRLEAIGAQQIEVVLEAGAPVVIAADVAPEVEARVRELARAQDACSASERAAEQALRRLATFVHAADNEVLPRSLRDRLGDADGELILERISDRVRDIEVRLSAVNDELDKVTQHRKILAQSLEGIADPALRLIRRLASGSRFPPDVEVWAGEPFIRAELRIPPTAAEREAAVAHLLDQIVSAPGEIPSGLRLVQRLVRELTRGGGLEVKVLKPEAHRRLSYEPIEKLRAFSRGEQLTGAILLYCTLARLRAIECGKRRTPTSVLILDNPLGTCSKPEFVELQRAMARHHGIQLIYTTGIEDLEALSRLPSIVRLRNEHRDAAGRFHVTVDPAGGTSTSRIDAVRIVRAEPA